jgi:hypothetical protein
MTLLEMGCVAIFLDKDGNCGCIAAIGMFSPVMAIGRLT